MAQKGFAIRLAPQNAYRSMIWIHDAASAVVEALESAPSGVFDAVESEPYTQMQSVHALANATGRKSLLVLPRWLLRIFLPAEMRGLVARSQRISNKRFCNLTGWRPSVPDQQKGWALMGSDYNM
ncbi:MAG: NAD(P)-dependent oxidoreductase [Rhodomicrobium sp.]|nr:NAD(P)-dependent oxidoreductase [Rhodomicrobium sp.]